jgi:outer membrane protein OmpA-like peptidoglycan-associated protein
MNKIILVFIFFTWMNLSTIQAQNPAFPQGITMKTLFMDYQSQNGGDISNFSAYHSGFEVGYLRSLNENINLVVPIKYGVVTSHDQEFNNCFHKKVYGLDATGQYMFTDFQSDIRPYGMLGLGGQLEQEGEFNVQIPFGAGVYFKVAENAYINWQSEYRYALKDNRNNLHHGLGFTYLFGSPVDMEKEMEDNEEIIDSDNDGLEDDIDLCPQIAGPIDMKGCPDGDDDGIPDYRDDCPAIPGTALFRGCPDSDGDGISDSDDECPNMAGTKENNGCPDNDTDMDGIPDNLDKCPNTKGTVENNGCPDVSADDKDGDGIPDAEDRCPNIKGSASASGCPDRDSDGVSDYDDRCPDRPGLRALNGCPDSDGDGIDDSRDKCPSQPGSVANNGCPGIDASDLSTLETAMRAVQFETGKATLKSESYPVLNQISTIMDKYPGYNLIIAGHTDNVGSAVNNQLLSERRAQACFEYLIRRGVSSSRMSHTGYGESNPISDNNSLSGRALNRRVEFNLKPR